MTHDEILKLFTDTKVITKGHFILTSGRHSDTYMQCAKLFQYPEATEKACRELTKQLKGLEIETVAGPAVGAINLSYEMARALKARSIFAEREDGKMTLRRGFSVEPGEKVLVVEDVVTTGGSVKEVVSLLQSLGADVVGVAVLIDRSAGATDFGVPAHYLLSLEAKSYEPGACPLCKEGTPAIKPGSRSLGK